MFSVPAALRKERAQGVFVFGREQCGGSGARHYAVKAAYSRCRSRKPVNVDAAAGFVTFHGVLLSENG